MKIVVCNLFLLLLMQGCAPKKDVPVTTPDKQAVFAKVIDYSEVSGCTYLLELSDGKKLEPVNLEEQYRRVGLKLFITYKIYDGVSVCMAGKMVTLTSVSPAKEDHR